MMKRMGIICTMAVVMATAPAWGDAKGKSFKLESGKFQLTITADGKDKVIDVTLEVKDNKFTISKGSGKNIEGSLDGNKFTARLEEGKAVMEFMGTLTADNEVSGKVVGNRDGETEEMGPFKLRPAK